MLRPGPPEGQAQGAGAIFAAKAPVSCRPEVHAAPVCRSGHPQGPAERVLRNSRLTGPEGVLEGELRPGPPRPACNRVFSSAGVAERSRVSAAAGMPGRIPAEVSPAARVPREDLAVKGPAVADAMVVSLAVAEVVAEEVLAVEAVAVVVAVVVVVVAVVVVEVAGGRV